VRGRVIGGFALLGFILAAVVVGSAWQLRQHRSDTAAMESSADTTFLLQEAQVNVQAAAASLQRYVIVGDEILVTGDEDLIAEIRASEAAAVDSLEQVLAQEEARGDEEDVARLNEISNGAAALIEGVEAIISLRQSGDVAVAVAAMEATVLPFREFEDKLNEAAEFERQELSALRSQADSGGELALALLIISGAAGAALGLIASAIVARSIIRPLSSLEATAVAVSKGNLKARARAVGPRELSHLGSALNDMMEAIEERAQELRFANDELRDRNRQLMDARAQAATDQLTGVLNHRKFHERIANEVVKAKSDGKNLGLIMMDIDDFKGFNDALGHQAGDEILRSLSPKLAKVVTKENTYRYGGDEFAILLPGADSKGTTQVAEKVRKSVATVVAGNGQSVTVSLGVAAFPEMAESHEELIYRADMAMYWAKSSGKNRVGDWDSVLSRRDSAIGPHNVGGGGSEDRDIVTALTAAIRAKDSVTSSHSERCSSYATKLAQEVGLGEEETSALRLAALLHDIGKLAVPRDVLCKPGPLDDDEWAQMRQHPTTAMHILSGMGSLAAAIPTIIHHHEHFDGTGYPNGLAGDDIPLASRILLVADAYDAMTTDRPYRKAMSTVDAIEELERNSGSQFDPAVVEAFLRMLGRDGADALQTVALADGESRH
jgi:diguanylate cyclase (GGDEF)-like protein/putative nucleotidyltransferase with HDIG domain